MPEKFNQEIEEQIAQLNRAINEVKYVQENLVVITQKNHKNTIKKLDKICDYNQINDMTNQVFESRITNIEAALNEIIKKLSA